MPRPPASSPADASMPGAPSDVPNDPWAELAGVLDQLALLAKQAPGDEEFYPEMLRACVAALAAEAGAVWAADDSGRIKRRCVAGDGLPPLEEAQRQAHEALLTEVLRDGVARVYAPAASTVGSEGGPGAANATSGVLLIAPVGVEEASGPRSLVELTLRTGGSPSTYESARRFLEAACEIASEHCLRREVRSLRADQQERRRMAQLARRVAGDLDLRRTCHRMANEARDALRCDRVSMVVFDGQPRLTAVSGADRVDRRTPTARGLEELSHYVRQFREPLCLLDGQGETHESTDALDRYADISHARQLIAAPVFAPDLAIAEDAADSRAQRAVVGVLVVEQFDAASADLDKVQIAEAVEICAPALAAAHELSSLPLLGLSRALRGHLTPGSLRRSALLALGLAAVVAALAFIPANFYIEAQGELQPVLNRQVFAPRSGLVEKVHVEHGETVVAGAPLVDLRDPQLDLALQQIEGQIESARRRHDAIATLRTRPDDGADRSLDQYRLSAEQELLAERIRSLEAQQALLTEQREALAVKSPAAGSVTSWGVQRKLVGRPVERGETLLSVADTQGDWQIELGAPDERIGHLLRFSQRSDDQPLRVEYRLASEERGFATGVVSRIAGRAEPSPQGGDRERIVQVVVTPDDPQQPATDPNSLRPGQSVRARIHCGTRSLGYVWLHDLWHTLKTWWQF